MAAHDGQQLLLIAGMVLEAELGVSNCESVRTEYTIEEPWRIPVSLTND